MNFRRAGDRRLLAKRGIWMYGKRVKNSVNLLKTVIVSVLTVALCFGMIRVPVSAETILGKGTWGSNLNWKVDTTGTLTIWGTGRMYDAEEDDYHYPWQEEAYGITNLNIKYGVTSIAPRAFSGLTYLCIATFPDSLREIGNGAFYGCGFETVTISKGVKAIGDGPFCNNPKLKFIDVSPWNDYYKSVNGVLYSKDSYRIVQFPCALGGYYKAIDGVGYVGKYAFQDSKITGVALPEDLRVIQYGAFSGCTELSEVILPEGMYTIEAYAFDSCSNLSMITLPTTLMTIGEYAFNGDGPVLGVSYKGTEYQWNSIKIGPCNDRIYTANKSFYDPYDEKNIIKKADCRWLTWGSTDYWYEDGVRQGTVFDPKGVKNEYGDVRGREIYDPASDSWYWLDSLYSGAKAKNKEVWMPYVYNGEENMTDEEMIALAERSGDMKEQVLEAMRLHGMERYSGKWVRYDSNGKMIKGWYAVGGADAAIYPNEVDNIYYYDPITGLMAKGWTQLGPHLYHFNEVTGALWK